MADVEQVRIESDDRGFELHLIIGDDIVHHDDGRVVLNIQGVAEELLHECVRQIGPWVLEGRAARREYDRAAGHPMCPDEDGECVHGHLDCPSLGPDEPRMDVLLDMADYRRKADRENGAA